MTTRRPVERAEPLPETKMLTAICRHCSGVIVKLPRMRWAHEAPDGYYECDPEEV